MPKNQKGAFVGIDPGKRGAAALWDTSGALEIFDFTTGERAAKVLRHWRKSFDIRLVALEMPQFHPKDGKISIRELGRNTGLWEGLLIALKLKYIPVSPSQWKRSIPPLPVSDPKRKAVQYCTMIFKGSETFLKRIKDHDRAEALLLAYYAYEWDKFRK